MPFLIDNFRGDEQIIVNDGTINTVDTSIGLIGKGSEVYGEQLNENFLHILESFASIGTVGPANPKLGQLWYNLDAGGPGFHSLNVCRSESPIEWAIVTSDAFNLPAVDGNPGEFIQTDGSGNLSFEPVVTELSEDLSPVLADDLNANSHKIFNLAVPTTNNDATTKVYVDVEISDAIAALDLVALGGAVFVAKAGEIANDGAGSMTGLIFNENGLPIATQLAAAGRAPNDVDYLPTREMIEGSFLQGFPFPPGPTPISQKYDVQTLFDASVSEAQLIDGAVVTWNVDGAQVAHLDLAAGSPGVIAVASNMQDGGTYTLIISQDGTGGRVMTFTSGGTGSYKWPGGVAPVLTTAANAVDIFTFISDGTFMYGVAQQNFS